MNRVRQIIFYNRSKESVVVRRDGRTCERDRGNKRTNERADRMIHKTPVKCVVINKRIHGQCGCKQATYARNFSSHTVCAPVSPFRGPAGRGRGANFEYAVRKHNQLAAIWALRHIITVQFSRDLQLARVAASLTDSLSLFSGFFTYF